MVRKKHAIRIPNLLSEPLMRTVRGRKFYTAQPLSFGHHIPVWQVILDKLRCRWTIFTCLLLIKFVLFPWKGEWSKAWWQNAHSTKHPVAKHRRFFNNFHFYCWDMMAISVFLTKLQKDTLEKLCINTNKCTIKSGTFMSLPWHPAFHSRRDSTCHGSLSLTEWRGISVGYRYSIADIFEALFESDKSIDWCRGMSSCVVLLLLMAAR